MEKETIYTTIRLENSLHSKLRILSIVRDSSIQSLLEEAVSDFVEKNER
jgi:predicted transcriptional regulator